MPPLDAIAFNIELLPTFTEYSTFDDSDATEQAKKSFHVSSLLLMHKYIL